MKGNIKMDRITINITIEDGIISIRDNMGNESNNDFDPDCTIADQIGTYVADHIEANQLYQEIINEGIENADYMDDDDDDFDD